MKYFKAVLYAAIVLSIAALGFVSCTDNPVDDPGEDCDHIDADGVVVAIGDSTISVQWLGQVSDTIHLHVGDTLGPITVSFLDPDSNVIVVPPSCADHELRWTGHDESIVAVNAVSGQRWQATAIGVSGGATSIRFRIWHGQHSDFTSLEFPIEVEEHHGEEHPEAEGLRLVHDGDTLVWVDGSTVTGEIELHHEETSEEIDVWFIDDHGDLFQPDDPDEVWLTGSIADTTIANFASLDSAAFGFTLEGIEEGMTELTLSIVHDGHADYTSPAIEVHVEEGGHQEAEGLRIVSQGDTLVSIDGSTVTGELALSTPDSLESLEVWFVDHDDSLFRPEHPDEAWIVLSVADTSIADVFGVDTVNSTFGLRSKSTGVTELTVEIYHDGHSDYASPAITVDVNGGSSPSSTITAVAVEYNSSMLASWNYDEEQGANEIFGYIVLEEGAGSYSFDAVWLDTLRDSYGVRLPADISNSAYTLRYSLTGGSAAQLSEDPQDKARFSLTPMITGTNTLTIELLHNDVVFKTSGAIPIIVRNSTVSNPDSASFIITKSGVWYISCIDGVVNTADSVCDRGLVGQLEVDEGETTDLFSYYLPEAGDDCRRDSPSMSSRTFVFEFADSSIARVVNHPVHWGEDRVFHVEGLTSGMTQIRIHSVRSNLSVEYTTPWIPVEVLNP